MVVCFCIKKWVLSNVDVELLGKPVQLKTPCIVKLSTPLNIVLRL